MTFEAFYGPEIVARSKTPLPEGYRSYRACKEYFMREAGAASNLTPAGTEACPGAHWFHGPLYFEKYVTDTEPPYDPEGRFRLTIWQPLTRIDKPPGWRRATQGMGLRMTGYAEVGSADGQDWSPHARRHLAHWKKLVASGKREIVDVPMGEYLAAYAKADQDRTMKTFFPGILREKAKAHGDRFHLIGSRRPGGPIDAGLAYLHIPEVRQSTHVSAFMAGEGKKDSASTGLIAEWFKRCGEEGIELLDFGFFWAPGDPKDWQGFSRFKAQFAVRLMRYPKPLMRWFGRPFWRKK